MLSLCSSRGATADVEIHRAFSLIGVMRNVNTDEVPLDLIYLYLTYTDPTSLRDILFFSFQDKSDIKRDKDLAIGNRLNIPKGLGTMATRFLKHCCQQHVAHLLALTGNKNVTCDGNEVVKCYPAFVNRVLRQLTIPRMAKLNEVKHLIDALHGALCPVYDRTMINKEPLDAVSEQKIMDLRTLIWNTMYDDEWFLSPYLRNTFCNLLEVILLLQTIGVTYSLALCIRWAYDFSRTFSEDRGAFVVKPDTIVPIQTPCGVMDKALSVLSRLSPQAALCVGFNDAVKYIDQEGDKFDLLKPYDVLTLENVLSTNKTPSRETALYMQHEIELEKIHLREHCHQSIINKEREYGL